MMRYGEGLTILSKMLTKSSTCAGDVVVTEVASILIVGSCWLN